MLKRGVHRSGHYWYRCYDELGVVDTTNHINTTRQEVRLSRTRNGVSCDMGRFGVVFCLRCDYSLQAAYNIPFKPLSSCRYQPLHWSHITPLRGSFLAPPPSAISRLAAPNHPPTHAKHLALRRFHRRNSQSSRALHFQSSRIYPPRQAPRARCP
jgi:hypothetical protein